MAPPLLMATTYPVFLASQAVFGESVDGHLAWFVGMTFYWVTWCGTFSLVVIGRRRVRELILPRRFDATMAAHIAVFVGLAVGVRYLVPGMAYGLATATAVTLLVISTFANGLFEELLWRGAYLDVFSNNWWLRVLWPSVWFGLWHLVPGSIATGGPHIAMVIGPFFMGIYLGFMAKQSSSVWWPMLAHALGGLVMIS